MTDTQPRTPPGSPAGGQFGVKPGGAEAATELVAPAPKHKCDADCWPQIIRYGIDPDSNTGDCDPFLAQALAEEALR